MFNLLKADLLKLKYSKTWIITLVSVIALYIIYIVSGDGAFVYGFGPSEDYTLGEGIGFLSQYYTNINNPLPGEVMRTAMSYTVFIWIIILVFTISFFTKEYSDRTIKLSIASGQSRFKIYISKLIIICSYSFILYYLFTFFIFAHASFVVNFTPSISDALTLLKLTTLNFMAMIVFILIILLLSMLIKNKGATNTIMCFFIFACPMVYMMVWFDMDNQPLLIQIFLRINPMYYWSTISAYNFNNNIINETIIYFLVSMIVLIPLTYSVIRKQEIR